MIRTQEATGKTVDEARAKACALLGVQAEDMNVSYEVLEMPQKTGFLGLKLTLPRCGSAWKSPMHPRLRRHPPPQRHRQLLLWRRRWKHPLRRKLLRPEEPKAEEAAPAAEAAPAEEAEEVEVPSTSKRTARSRPL